MIEVLRERSLQVNGLAFEALEAGPAAGELVLLLHGFPQFADSWVPLLKAMGSAGFHAVAVSQRGYSPGARPEAVADYDLAHLTGDVLGFTNALGAERFHLVGHDWGAVLAWMVAGRRPERVRSLTALAVPHPDAFFKAVRSDPDQMWKSKYIALFKMPGHLAETMFLADGAKRLREVYGGRLTPEQVEANVQRLSEPGALTAALNWYRALSLHPPSTGPIRVPTMYLWGDCDIALGETAALATKDYVEAPYDFQRFGGGSHWLLEEFPERIEQLVLDHIGRRAAAGGKA